MSPPEESNGRSSPPREGEGVLANLPRTRPQRATPRRAAARKAASGNGAVRVEGARASSARSKGAPSPTAARKPRAVKSAAGKRRAPSAAKAAGRTPPGEERVPRQGFACEGESASGPVQPPGGAELVASAMEMVGEVARAGLSTGERLLKDVLSRLPLS